MVASYCLAAWLAYGILAFYGAPVVGGELRWLGSLAGTYLDALRRVPPQFIGAIALGVADTVLAVSAWRAWRLRAGGAELAHWLGARYVDPERCSPHDRRLLNVVSEMSIASGVREPPVYVLRNETSVNALVAGHDADDAAIVVTQGAVDLLSRNELQGMLGHEFSHILNGDMALNLRLACLLAGLGWIGQCGEEMVWRDAALAYGRDGESTAGPMALFGALIALIGFPGVLAADAVKAAISRERERLADAASVQFTRDPDALAGALDSILALHASTGVRAVHALELSHMFFAPLHARWWSFATHPSIEARIAAVRPGFDRGDYRQRRHGTRRQIAVLDGGGEVVKVLPLR